MKTSFKPYFQLFKTYVGPQKWRVVILGILIFISLGLQLLLPQMMRQFIDSVTQSQGTTLLFRLAASFLGIAILQQLVAIGTSYYTQNVGWQATNALREDLAEHLLSLDLSFHKVHPPGEMISRIDSDVMTLNHFFSQFFLKIFGNIVLVVTILVLLFLEDWRIGLLLSAFSVFALFILIRFRNIGVPHWEAERKAESDFYSFLEERLAGSVDVRANGGRPYTLRLFFKLIQEMYRRSTKAGLTVNIMLNAMLLLFAIGNALSLGLGGALFLNGVFSIGTVYIIYSYNVMLQRPLEDISRQISEVQKAFASLKRVTDILRVTSRITAYESRPLPKRRYDQAPMLAFDSVSFYYDDRPQDLSEKDEQQQPQESVEMTLEDINFQLAPGEVLGLLGRTGSGKTTLTRLLFRLYDPQQGKIFLGHPDAEGLLDIRQLPLPFLRQQIGMVTQTIELFHASVRDNLTFFDPSIPDKKILALIDTLGLSHWFANMPSGLDTILESGGSGLSAGEAQLLAFIRIFLRNPRLVVLDEASSRLDPATEQRIEHAVDRLVTGRTAVIIAHRLKTVQRADKILILENGKVTEFGDRRALAPDPSSKFYALLKKGITEVLV